MNVHKNIKIRNQLVLANTTGSVSIQSNTAGSVYSLTLPPALGATNDLLQLSGSQLQFTSHPTCNAITIGTSTITSSGNTVQVLLPAASDTLVGLGTVDVLSNKTLVAPRATTLAVGTSTANTMLQYLGATTQTLTLPATAGAAGKFFTAVDATTTQWRNLALAGDVVGGETTTTVNTKWQGMWQAGSYVAGNLVTLNNKLYMAATATTSVPPAAPWQVVVAAPMLPVGVVPAADSSGLLTQTALYSATGMVGVGVVPTSRLHVAGAVQAAAWSSRGIQLNLDTATYTDTSSSGVVPLVVVASMQTPTLAAITASTYTRAATLYVAGAPLVGSNVAIAAAYALMVAGGRCYMGGNIEVVGDYTSIAQNCCFGTLAGGTRNGSNNCAIGDLCMQSYSDVGQLSNNTAVGKSALYNMTAGRNNTVVGALAAATVVTGMQNTLLGAATDVTTSSDSNCVALGYNVKATTNCVVVGNLQNTSISSTGNATCSLGVATARWSNVHTMSAKYYNGASGCTVVAPTLAADTTLTLPTVSGVVATLAGIETLTNKTLVSAVMYPSTMVRFVFSDTAYTVPALAVYIAQVGTITVTRVVTLPLANSVVAGNRLVFADESGSVTTAKMISITRSGSDTVSGATLYNIGTAYGSVTLVSDGASKWTVIAAVATAVTTTATPIV